MTRYARSPWESEWIISEAPELRIIPAALAARVERRHQVIADVTAAAKKVMGNAGRSGPSAHHLFSGLLICDNCGALHDGQPWSLRVQRIPVSRAFGMRRGATVTRQRMESRLLDAIRGDLYNPAAMALYRKAFITELKRLSAQARPDVAALKRRLSGLDASIANMVAAIANGTYSSALRAALEQAEAERSSIAGQLAKADLSALVIALPVDLDALFRNQIAHLEAELDRDVDAVREVLRDMLGTVRIARRDNALVAELSGIYQGAKYASFGSGGRIWTYDLRVMSPTSCLTAPPRNWAANYTDLSGGAQA
jgi:site-specific DNA recombinase